MYDELKANVFPKLPKRIVQMSVFVREMKQSIFVSSHHFVFHLIFMHFVILPVFFFYTQIHTQDELKLPKRNVCKTFYNTLCTTLSQQPCEPLEN